jgi:2-dehydropantoate 2-reductase
MRIAIIGAGAIGGFVGGQLAHAGEDVTFIARGATLEALKARGIRVTMADGTEKFTRRVNATSDYSAAGPQDLVMLALKAHQVEAVAADVPRLFGPDTVVLPMQNGIPFWYFHKHGGPLEGRPVTSVDPTGVIRKNIPCERVIGCVVYPATEQVGPGEIKQIEGNRFPVGDLDGSESERVKRVSGCFARGGMQSPILPDIRAEMWLKLWGNMTFNPMSALSRATLAAICQYSPTRELARCMMEEAQAIAHSLGITFRVPIEKRIAGAERVGHHKTSMLQDVEAGRPLETDALLGSVIELGRMTETPTPHLDAVFALTKLLEQSLAPARAS